jgi:hypothetical protein
MLIDAVFLDKYLPFIIFGAVILSIGGILIFVYFSEKKRTELMMQAARQRGFSFKPKPELAVLEKYKEFKLFNKGHSKKIRNMMEGSKNGKSFIIFDYRYTIGGGKSSHTYNQTVAVVKLYSVIPLFYLGPQYFFHRIGEMFGSKDIDFEKYPVFSKMYLLKGGSEHAIRQLFNDEVISYFEKQPKGVNIESDGKRIAYYRLSKRVKPEQLDSFLEEASKVVGFFDKEEF